MKTKITKSFMLDNEAINYIKEQARKQDRSESWIVNNLIKKEKEENK